MLPGDILVSFRLRGRTNRIKKNDPFCINYILFQRGGSVAGRINGWSKCCKVSRIISMVSLTRVRVESSHRKYEVKNNTEEKTSGSKSGRALGE